MYDQDIEYIRNSITNIQDFPKPGILFRDITSLIEDRKSFLLTVEKIAEHYRDAGIDKIAAPEARGFIFAAAVAARINAGIILIRKPGKLPRKYIEESYSLEYGTATVQCHVDSVVPGDKVLVLDDLIATGGTAIAAANLVRKLGGIVEDAAFVINLKDLPGVGKLKEVGINSFCLLEFEGE